MPPGFLIEPESAIGGLKDEAQWNEVEQLLDNPYAVVLDPLTPGNAQGWPSYRSTIQRRRSFLPAGCTYDTAVVSGTLPLCNDAAGPGPSLQQFLVHPLNYNPTTGEEMRVVNPAFTGAPWDVPFELVQCTAPGVPSPACPNPLPGTLVDPPVGTYVWTYATVDVSPGADRIEAGEVPIDYNSPIADTDPFAHIVSLEANPPEGSIIIGRDPGEPGYSGFGAARSAGQYSVAAVPGGTGPVVNPDGTVTLAGDITGLLLYDPTPDEDTGGEGVHRTARFRDPGRRAEKADDRQALGVRISPIPCSTPTPTT